ncbi:hypothetical protein GCM10009745_68700 [Kribbella yunnanensis]|uniref:Uncharacterized protein n=1 Tax=Kribbella yunnanensis TaxID=190194 RepID=A0ABN2ISK1_9ACTN
MRKPELVPAERGRGIDVGDVQDRFGARDCRVRSLRALAGGWGRFRACLEFGPAGAAGFEGDDLLGFGQGKLQRECFAVGQRAVALELSDATAD